MAVLGAEEKFALISENLAEVLNPELIQRILAEGRNVRVYWGMLVQTSNCFLLSLKISQELLRLGVHTARTSLLLLR